VAAAKGSSSGEKLKAKHQSPKSISGWRKKSSTGGGGAEKRRGENVAGNGKN